MAGGRKAEQLAVAGAEAADEGAKVGVPADVGIVGHAFPVVFGPAEGELPHVALAVRPRIVRGCVPGVVVEDAHGATGRHHRHRAAHVLAFGRGQKAGGRLILVHILEIEPEVELTVPAVLDGGWQEGIVAVVDVRRIAAAAGARVGDQAQAGPVLDLLGAQPTAGKGDGLAIDDGAVEDLFGIGKVVAVAAVGRRVVPHLVPRFEQPLQGRRHGRPLLFGEITRDDGVALGAEPGKDIIGQPRSHARLLASRLYPHRRAAASPSAGRVVPGAAIDADTG